MINNIFPLTVQAAVQAVTESTVVVPFESATLWIDDCITWWLVFDN